MVPGHSTLNLARANIVYEILNTIDNLLLKVLDSLSLVDSWKCCLEDRDVLCSKTIDLGQQEHSTEESI